jgi:hypothetical protein
MAIYDSAFVTVELTNFLLYLIDQIDMFIGESKLKMFLNRETYTNTRISTWQLAFEYIEK